LEKKRIESKFIDWKQCEDCKQQDDDIIIITTGFRLTEGLRYNNSVSNYAAACLAAYLNRIIRCARLSQDDYYCRESSPPRRPRCSRNSTSSDQRDSSLQKRGASVLSKLITRDKRSRTRHRLHHQQHWVGGRRRRRRKFYLVTYARQYQLAPIIDANLKPEREAGRAEHNHEAEIN